MKDNHNNCDVLKVFNLVCSFLLLSMKHYIVITISFYSD